MLSEHFIDIAIDITCATGEHIEKKYKIFESLSSVIGNYIQQTKKEDIPIEFRDKVAIAAYLSHYRRKNRNFDFKKLLMILETGTYRNLVPVLEKRQWEPTYDQVEELNNIVLSKKKLSELTSEHTGLQVLLDDLGSGNFPDDTDIINRWEEHLQRIHNVMSKIKREEAVTNITRLNLRDGDYGPVMDDLKDLHTITRSITSGFEHIDLLLKGRGFEPRRFYLIGGTSNIGKSALLTNFLCEAVIRDNSNPDEYFVYITGENLIGESLERMWCVFTETSYNDLVKKELNDPDFTLKTKIVEILNEKKATVDLCYVKPGITTVGDIRMLLDEIAEYHKIAGIYIDYLDLIKSGDPTITELRFDQGAVGLAFKDFSIDYDCPVFSATQLNRSGYKKDEEPSLTQMGESMKKVDNADWIIYLQEGSPYKGNGTGDDKNKSFSRIRATTLKARNSAKNESCTLRLWTTEKIYVGEKEVFIDIFNYKFDSTAFVGTEEHSANNQSQKNQDHFYNNDKDQKKETAKIIPISKVKVGSW